ncbi:putative nucleotidyltransferase substrate binding domain-containing protein [Variovorax sp. GT1P44]|uniref:putative nucleotidyltransferase substrate binding domain-containing protein n=1 Tax=Variovorax sp. GT1P44 TaxID=3443742 RepID=UPI003F46363A
MPNAFDFSASPFDCLDEAERKIVRDSVDIAYFREGEAILEPGAEPAHLFIIIKGHVSQFDGGEAVAGFGPNDCFDGRSLMAGFASSRFVAAEEVVAYLLAKAAVHALIARNATFGALLFSDLSNKLGALAQRHEQREMHALTMSRVEEAFLRPAHVVEGAADIVSVARLMQAEHASSVLVRDGERLGIFTNTGLQRAVVDGQPLAMRPVRDLATFSLVSIAPDAPLFDALALMIRHQVHRLVVADGPRVVGLLEQLDLLSFLSNHSYLITVRIVRAQSLDALRSEAGKITGFIALLYRSGTRVGQIGKLVQALNAKLFERTWQLVAPPELLADSCLFVMGSEGRGEQLLKTDQDNGLVLRDGTTVGDVVVASTCQRFSDALRDFGYPDCPGGIMVSNPDWRHRASDFRDRVRRWLLLPDPEGLIALATFIDAHAVAGDASLLGEVRAEVDRLVTADDALLGRFAAPIDLFPDAPSGWWNRLLLFGEHERQAIDLKRGGIFPIVHGVRSLALRDHVRATSTTARLDALVASGRLPIELANDLADSLHYLMGLKLKAGLAELEGGRAVSGNVQVERLSSLERDLLKDALAVVKRFKALVRFQFHLERG